MIRNLWVVVFGLVGLFASSLPARADDIDEKEKDLATKITIAAQHKQINAKDVAALRKQMAKFNHKKRELKTSGGDVLTIQDDAQLEKALNVISQDLDSKKKHR